MLLGTEIKSLREGKGSIDESYARDKEGELVLVNSHIPHYKPANLANHKPERIRKLLLLHQKTIISMVSKKMEQ